MNEFLFFLHVLTMLGFCLGALRLGKEALIVWTVVQALLANLFVLKQIDFFHFTVTASDVFAIGSIVGLNLLQEYYDKKAAGRATVLCFYFMLFFAFMAKMHLFYLPSTQDTTHDAYAKVLSAAPRLLFASLSVFFLVQKIDMRFFSFLKKKLPSTPLYARNFLSLFVTQLIDTVLFSFLGLYGLVDCITDIIFVSFLVKLSVILSTTTLLAFAKRIIKQPLVSSL